MANAAYNLWLQAQVGSTPVNWGSDTIRVVALSSAYTFSQAHQFHSDLTGVLGNATLASKTSASGVLDAADAVISGVLASAVASIVIEKWTGTAGTSQLLLYFDQGIGFGQTPTGDTTIIFPNDANVKIFPLGGKP
jgi:hypothetical protein